MVENVYCAIRTDSLYKADYVSCLKGEIPKFFRGGKGGPGVNSVLETLGPGIIKIFLCGQVSVMPGFRTRRVSLHFAGLFCYIQLCCLSEVEYVLILVVRV